MNSDQQRILDHVDVDQIVALASDLIRIPSFKGEEQEAARFVVAYLAERGFETELQEVEPGRFNAIGRLRGSGSGRSLMLNGHIDIDPLARDWKRDPWTPTIDNARLYGAGIANMKAGVASMIGAADAIRRSGVAPAGDIVIAAVCGELQGGVGSRYIARNGPHTDAAIVPEPYGADNVLTVHAGIVEAAVHVLGRSRHIREKHLAVDAIEKSAKAAAALRNIRFTYTPRADVPDLPMSLVGSIIGGQGRDHDMKGPNYVSDFVTMIVDVRFNHSQTLASVEADIRGALDAVKAGDPDFDYELEFPADPKRQVAYVAMEPYDLPVETPIVQTVLEAYRAVTGGEPKTAGGALVPASYAGNDTSHLWAAGIPGVLYGPLGTSDLPEHPDRYVAIAEMERHAKVTALAAATWCA